MWEIFVPICVMLLIGTIILILMKKEKVFKPIPKDAPCYRSRKFLSKIWAVGMYSILVVIFFIADELYEAFVLYVYFLLNVLYAYYVYSKENDNK